MYHFIIKLLQIEVLASSSYISIFVIVPLQISIYSCKKGISSDIKFSAGYQQWVFDILLNDIGLSRISRFQNFISDVIYRAINCNSMTSIGVFTWFDDPQFFLIVFCVSMEIVPLLIICSIDNMPGHWKDGENIALPRFIIFFHISI